MDSTDAKNVYTSFYFDMTSDIFNKLISGNLVSHKWDFRFQNITDSSNINKKQPQYSVALEVIEDLYKFSVVVYKDFDQQISIETQSVVSFLSFPPVSQSSLTDFNISTQSNAYADATVEAKSKSNQCFVENKDGSSQSHIEQVDSFGQTDAACNKELGVQAVMQFVDANVQHSAIMGDCLSQTNLCMLHETESSTQASTDLITNSTQVETAYIDSHTQVELITKECDTQCLVISNDIGCQMSPLLSYTQSQTSSSMANETDSTVQAVVEINCTFSQTEVKTSISECQAGCSTFNMIEGQCQTDSNLASIESQTECSMFKMIEFVGQTDCSMLNMIEFEGQTDTCMLNMIEFEGQTDTCMLNMIEFKGQTDTSMLNMIEFEGQTDTSMLNMIEFEGQTDTSMLNMIVFEGQTDCSMINMIEFQGQTDSSMLSMVDFGNQKDSSISITHEVECQTGCSRFEMCDFECQSNEVVADEYEQSDLCFADSNPTVQKTMESQCDAESTSNSKLHIISLLDTTSGITDNQAEPSEYLRNNYRHGISQTDPVTIIIGDASFLINRLKTAALDSSKVVTSGNEIQIELNESVEIQTDFQPPPQPETPISNNTATFYPVIRTKLHAGRINQQTKPVVVFQPLASSSSPSVFSCPFCASCFADSTMLYSHLNHSHQQDQKTNHHKPKGRSGKTTKGIIETEDILSPKRRKVTKAE